VNQEIQDLKEKVKELNILYCEDEEEMRLGSELFLNKFFNNVDAVSDGQKGLEKFKQNRHQVVFTDIMMPNMNGLEMLKNIKEIDKKVYTITLTASEITQEDMQSISNLYFRKPISYANMLLVMKEIVKKFEL